MKKIEQWIIYVIDILTNTHNIINMLYFVGFLILKYHIVFKRMAFNFSNWSQILYTFTCTPPPPFSSQILASPLGEYNKICVALANASTWLNLIGEPKI